MNLVSTESASAAYLLPCSVFTLSALLLLVNLLVLGVLAELLSAGPFFKCECFPASGAPLVLTEHVLL